MSRGVSPVASPLSKGFLRFFDCSRVLLALCACVVFSQAKLAAYPINFDVSGTLGPEIGAGTPLFPAGSSFHMTGSMDSTANPPIIPTLTITIAGITITATNAPVTVVAGNPGVLSIQASVTLLSNPLSFTAVAKVTPALLYSVPYAFGSETIIPNSTNPNGSAISYTYKTSSGQQAIASGTVSATTTAPTLTTNGPFTFNFQIGGAPPVTQQLTVSGGSGVAFDAATSGGWLSVVPGSGATPGTLTLSANPSNLT